MNVKDVGLPETVDHIATMQRNFTANSIGQLVAIALQGIKDEAQSRAPVFTGALRDSINFQMTGPAKGECFVGVDYAGAQEFGYMTSSGRIPGKNYFTPAALHGRQELIKMLQDYMRQNATRAGAKSISTGGYRRTGGKGSRAHKWQTKRMSGASKKGTYYYGKKSTTITKRKALLKPGVWKGYKQGGRRRRPGRKIR